MPRRRQRRTARAGQTHPRPSRGHAAERRRARSMQTKVTAGNALGAAMEAMANPAFYNTTVRELATPWTNRDRSVYAELNDSTATVIGMVRDDVPFDQVLYEDIVYVGSTAATPSTTRRPTTIITSSCSEPRRLEQHRQPRAPDAIDAAGHAARRRGDGGHHDDARLRQRVSRRGHEPRRRAVCGAQLLCMDMEDFRDVSAWPDRMRQDVSRSPGRRQQPVLERLPRVPRRARRSRRRVRVLRLRRDRRPHQLHAERRAAEVREGRRTPSRSATRPSATRGSTTGARARTRSSAGTGRARVTARKVSAWSSRARGSSPSAK